VVVPRCVNVVVGTDGAPTGRVGSCRTSASTLPVTIGPRSLRPCSISAASVFSSPTRRPAMKCASSTRLWGSPDGPHGRHLALIVIGSGPEPIARRIEFLPGVHPDATFRYCCEGWGLIQLYCGGSAGTQELRWSHTNHNTQKRASAWAAAGPRLGDPLQWNWPAVTNVSGRLNRAIRRMAVDKISSRPVLPHAARFIAGSGLRYEYGTGIRAAQSFGMSGR
jgi:hypothetical protein